MNRLNNLDALRLTGALLVILGHAYVLLGRVTEVPFIFGYTVSTFGVAIFFSISGYLISASWNRSRDLKTYFTARCLRIFPALITVVLVAIFVIGPLVTTLPIMDYFQSSQTYAYLKNIVLNPAYSIPGVFEQNIFPNSANGSLWTLPAEFFCYLVVPLVYVRFVPARVVAIGGLLVFSFYLSFTPPSESITIYGTIIASAASMWIFFAAGALLRTCHERFEGFFRADVAVLAILSQLTLVSLFPISIQYVTWILMPYAILTAGLANTPVVRRAARFGDLSYGIYVWAFPVQQIVILVFGPQRMLINLTIVTSITLVLAWLSWHLVESPSMELKDRLIKRSHQPAPDVHNVNG